MNGKPVNGKNDQEDLFVSSVWDENNKQFIVKVVNTKNAKQTISIEFNGLGDEVILTNCLKTTFHSDDLLAENTLDEPFKLTPITNQVEIEGHDFVTEILEKTFAVYKFTKENKKTKI